MNMSEFRLLPWNNGPVFEDDTIAVTGFMGDHLWLDTHGSHYIGVQSGHVSIDGHGRMDRGMYACVPGRLMLWSDSCRAMVVTAKRYQAMFTLGGPVEKTG